MSENYYEILGVDKNSTQEEIKKAYKTLSKKYHPDMGGDEEMFKKINEAYSILSDPDKKNRYDNPRTANHFGGFGDFDFGFRNNNHIPGKNVRINLKLTLEDVLNGVKKNIKYKRDIKCGDCNGHGGTDVYSCKTCNGNGVVIQTQQTPYGIFQTATTCHDCIGTGKTYKTICNTCHGLGTKEVDEIQEITIPRGVDTGMGLTYRNKGSHVKNATENGSLIVAITIEKHPVFERNGDNLTTTLNLCYTDLVLGTKVNVETIDKKTLLVDIQKLTKPNSNLRLRGYGLYNINNEYSHTRGDLILNVELSMPKEVTKEDEELLNKLKKS